MLSPLFNCVFMPVGQPPPFIPFHPLLCLVNMLNPEHIKLGTNHPDPESSPLYHGASEPRMLFEDANSRCVGKPVGKRAAPVSYSEENSETSGSY